MPYRERLCEVCHEPFTPPHRATILSTEDNHLRLCARCRRAAKDAVLGAPAPSDVASLHTSAAPMRQVVFDLETFGLDRGWGITMIASFLIHGYPDGPRHHTLTLRDFTAWKEGRRSDDRQMAEAVFEILRPCHIAYAHNGERFDLRWLRSVALKYGLDMPRLKLVDPCQIAWKRYALGRNSLEAVADFLNLEEKGKSKLHISPDVWRRALMDNSDPDWKLLVDRCESDVDLLNEVASRVTGDIGLVDYQGSWK